MDKKTRKAVWEYMRNVVSIFTYAGEVNCTALAEDASNHFEHPEWLDDTNHVVWDLAVDVGGEHEECIN